MDGQQPIKHYQCPNLAPSYLVELQSSVEYILERFPVLGFIASGSIIRGNPEPTSDFDMYVIHVKSQRHCLLSLLKT